MLLLDLEFCIFWPGKCFTREKVGKNQQGILKSAICGTMNNYDDYYSFKEFPWFWLVKTTCIIHHNQLLFARCGKNLHHIESMTSEVQLATDYWTNDIKKNLGMRLCFFCELKIKERNGETPLRMGKYFELIIIKSNNNYYWIWLS